MRKSETNSSINNLRYFLKIDYSSLNSTYERYKC